MKEIQLTRNMVTLVDDDMYEELNQFKWYAGKFRKTFYAVRNSSRVNGNHHIILMHHKIIGKPPKGFVTDHRDGDGLRNLRYNLRHITGRQNNQNKKNIKKTSKYPGVDWQRKNKNWRVQIRINGKQEYLGCFTDEEKAFEAYSQAVKALGEEMLPEHNIL